MGNLKNTWTRNGKSHKIWSRRFVTILKQTSFKCVQHGTLNKHTETSCRQSNIDKTKKIILNRLCIKFFLTFFTLILTCIYLTRVIQFKDKNLTCNPNLRLTQGTGYCYTCPRHGETFLLTPRRATAACNEATWITTTWNGCTNPAAQETGLGSSEQVPNPDPASHSLPVCL